MKKTLLIDNFDSFTFNLVQYVGELGGNPQVFRNNEISLLEVQRLKPSHIILSPGPGHPANKKYFGVCRDIIKNIHDIPLLGVCLGMQGIILEFGGNIIPAENILHGKTCNISHDGQEIFAHMSNPFKAMRYHSLLTEKATLPKCFRLSAQTSDGEIMAVSHTNLPFFGVQFHPESIGTPEGKKIIENFLSL